MAPWTRGKLDIRTITHVIQSLRGLVSEPVRCLIARRFALSIHAAITDKDAKKRFGEIGVPYFLKACGVQDCIPFVKDDLDVETTELAHFCNRWMTVQAFREPGVEKWIPFTANMHSLRSTMVAELKALSYGMTVDKLEKFLDNEENS